MVQSVSLPGTQALGKEFDSSKLYKSWVVCETVYGDLHYKDLQGSITRVGYCIPVPDLYLVPHNNLLSEHHSKRPMS